MSNSPRVKMARIVHRLLTDPRGISYYELRDAYGIKEQRTLRTYIEDLKDIPELFDEKGRTRVEVTGKEESRRIHLRQYDEAMAGETASRIVSVYFALSMLRFLQGTKLEAQIHKLYESLYKSGFKSFLLNLDKKIHSINEWPKDYSYKAKIVCDCILSLIHQTKLKIRYKPVNKESTGHELQIYTLLQYRNGLYLIARSDKGRKIMNFAVERITGSERAQGGFHYPQNYSPEKHIDGAFGLIRSDGEKHNVVVNFDKDLEEIVCARKWHKTAQTKILKNGTVQLSMTVSSLAQVVPWVLGFGSLATVIGPKELKDRVKEELLATAKIYNLEVMND